MALEAGTLRVTVHYAKDIKDCDWFGRQDPYVRLRIGSQERRSRVCRDGGRNPVWDQTFEFSVINENTLDLILMDEDTLKRDDLIGSCAISLARARERGHEVIQAPVSSGHKTHKQKGFIQVSLSFTPHANPTYAAYPAAPAMPPPPTAYVYPTSTAAPAIPHLSCGATAERPPPPYSYGYPASTAATPSYAPSASFYQQHSLPQHAAGAAVPPAPSAPPMPSAPAWPAQGPAQPTVYGTPAYGVPAQAPAYYAPPPAAAYGAAQYYR